MKQKVIPAISNMKDFEWFLESRYEYCIFMDFHIALLMNMVRAVHRQKKKVLIHMDLMHGLSGDEYGCEFACQQLGVDGVISTRGKVVETAKKNKRLAILRLFLIDSKSLEKGISLCNKTGPDYMEILPGIAASIYPYIRSRTNTPIMGGGLLKTQEQVMACLEAGVTAVTISDVKLIKEMEKEGSLWKNT